MSTTIHPGSVDDLSRLYREAILHHAQNPTGFRKAIRETHRNEQFNPLCGDRIILMLEMNGAVVRDAAFDGEACAICKASASLLCEHVPGQSVDDLNEARQWLELALNGADNISGHEILFPLLGARRYPSRVRCALLPWEALEGALQM